MMHPRFLMCCLIPLLLLSLHLVSALRVDISAITEYSSRTITEPTELFGRISSNRTFVVSDITAPSHPVNISVTFGCRGAQLVVANSTFGGSLTIIPRFDSTCAASSYSSAVDSFHAAPILIENVHASCDTARLTTTVCARRNNNLVFALLVELLPAGKPKCQVSVVLRRSLVEFHESNSVSSSSVYPVAFSVQNTSSVSTAGFNAAQDFTTSDGGVIDALPTSSSSSSLPAVSVELDNSTVLCSAVAAQQFIACAHVGAGRFAQGVLLTYHLAAAPFVEGAVLDALDARPQLVDNFAFYVRRLSVVNNSTVLVVAREMWSSNFEGAAVVLSGVVFAELGVHHSNVSTDCVRGCLGIWAFLSESIFTELRGGKKQRKEEQRHQQTQLPTISGNNMTTTASVSPTPPTPLSRPAPINITGCTFHQLEPTESDYSARMHCGIALIVRAVESIHIADCTFNSTLKRQGASLLQTFYVRNIAEILVTHIRIQSVRTESGWKIAPIEFTFVRDIETLAVSKVVANQTMQTTDSVIFAFRKIVDFDTISLSEFDVSLESLDGGEADLSGVWLNHLYRGRLVTLGGSSSILFYSAKGTACFYFDKGLLRDIADILIHDIYAVSYPSYASSFVGMNATFTNVSRFTARDCFSIHHRDNPRINSTEKDASSAAGLPPGAADMIPGGTSGARTVAITIMMFGIYDVILKNVTILNYGAIATAMGTYVLDDPTSEPDIFPSVARLTVSNCNFTLHAGILAAVALFTTTKRMTMPGYENGWYVIDYPLSGGLRTVQSSVSFFNVTSDSRAFISAVFAGQNTQVSRLLLRGCRVAAQKSFWAVETFPLKLDGRAVLLDVSGSASAPASCSTYNGVLLDDTSTIRRKVNNGGAPYALLNRHCGATYSATATESQTFYIPYKRTRTETNYSRTVTLTRTKSASVSATLVAPPIDLSTPAAASALNAIAGLTAVLGGAGPTVALDAARALAIVELTSQCAEFARSNQDDSAEERRRKFVEKFLLLEPGPFEAKNFFGIGFGPALGAQNGRGAILSHFLLLGLGFGVAMLLARKLHQNWELENQQQQQQQQQAEEEQQRSRRRRRRGYRDEDDDDDDDESASPTRPSSSSSNKQPKTVFDFSRAWMFCGLAFAFIFGPFVVQVTVIFSDRQNLPATDAMFFGVMSVLFWIAFAGFLTHTLFKHQLRGGANFPRWHVEASIVDFSAWTFKVSEEMRAERQQQRHQQLQMLEEELLGDSEMTPVRGSSNRGSNNRSGGGAVAAASPASSSSSSSKRFVWEDPSARRKRREKERREKRSSRNSNNSNRDDFSSVSSSSKSSSTAPLSKRFIRWLVGGIIAFMQSQYGRFVCLGHELWVDVSSAGQAIGAVGGAPGSALWRVGVLTTKYKGPYVSELELSRSVMESTKEMRAAAILSERSSIAGIPTRRYYFAPLRARVSPFYLLISLAFTFISCCAQGVALGDPGTHCSSSISLLAAINVAAFIVDAWLRPFIIPLKRYGTVLCSFLMAVGATLVAFSRKPPDGSKTLTAEQQEIITAAIGLVYSALGIVALLGVVQLFTKLFLLATGGGLVLRQKMAQQMEERLMSESQLLESVRSRHGPVGALEEGAMGALSAAGMLLL